MKIALLALIVLAGCSTAKTPFLISSDTKMSEENVKWTNYGPFNPDEARAFMDERKVSIEELLKPKIDPYKGEDSTPDLCKQKNLPEVVMKNGQGWFSKEISFYSSEHMVLGLCANPNRLMKTRYQMLYCESKKEVYVVQLFYSDELPWTTKFETKCR